MDGNPASGDFLDKKIIAIAIVAVVIVAAAAVVLINGNSNKDEDQLSIIGRVNTDGSGIFVKEGVDASALVTVVTEKPTSGYYLGGNGTWVVFNKEAWGGMVFGDPGAATIQHVQLNTVADTMGLKFVQYTNGTSLSSDTLYYIPGVASYASFVSTLNTTPAMSGAIFWEPQYSVALIDGCSSVATTNQMFPGHTCCVIGADTSYISGHSEETVRFLAAYIASVEKMTMAIQEGSGAAYDEVISIAKNKVALPDNLTDAQKEEAIKDAFELVVYKYADSTDKNVADPLADLKKDVASLAQELYAGGQIKNDYKALGFDSANALADKFVQSQYIKDAMGYERASSYDSKVNVKVAVIGGDIHQLAIHYGMATGIFESYGVNITLSSQTNGPAVYTAIHNGDCQFGFIGAPPMTINAMNAKEITA